MLFVGFKFGLIGMSILFILPGFAGLEGVFPIEIRKALDGLPLLPGESEIDILEFIVKTNLTGIRETRAEIDTINTRPINCTHAHGAGSAIYIEIATFEHLCPFRDGIGRAFRPGNHFENPIIALRTEKGFGIDAGTGVHDGGHLGMVDRNSSQKDTVLSSSDDLAILDDDGSERTAPSFLD